MIFSREHRLLFYTKKNLPKTQPVKAVPAPKATRTSPIPTSRTGGIVKPVRGTAVAFAGTQQTARFQGLKSSQKSVTSIDWSKVPLDSGLVDANGRPLAQYKPEQAVELQKYMTASSVAGPLRPKKVAAKKTGDTGTYENTQESLEQLERDRQKYYEQYGTSSPELEAYAFNLKQQREGKTIANALPYNPTGDDGTVPVPGGSAVRKDPKAELRRKQQAKNILSLSGADLQNVAARRRAERLT